MGLRAATIAAIIGCCAAAHAEDRNKAREQFKIAMQHYDLAEYKEALIAFKEAYRNFEDPSLLFNIGQCYRQLGDKEQAIRFYRTFLIKQPDSPRRVEVRDMIDKLDHMVADERRASAQPPQGTLVPPVAHEPPPTAVTPEPAPQPPPSRPALTPTPESTHAVVAAAPERRTPVYKKWWLWTAVGAVVLVGVGVGVGVALSGGATPTATTSFGTLHPF